MKRLEQLIDMARQLSGNTSYDANSGVLQKVFVQYFNNAQDSLMKNVVNLKTKYFKTTLLVPVVSAQERYAYPYNLYMHAIDTIQWTDGSPGTSYTPLTQSYTKEKVGSNIGYPYGYILQDDGYYLNPPISVGSLVCTYEKSLPRLQTKNGKITSVTINGSNQITALTVATTEAYDTTQINDDYYFCVVDKFGVQKARNIEYASETGGVFTLSPQALGTGQSIATGDYITIGENTTNKPEWPNICESFLLDFAVYSAKFTDSSMWTKEAKDHMAESFVSLSGSFASGSDDITQIPITNFDYIGF